VDITVGEVDNFPGDATADEDVREAVLSTLEKGDRNVDRSMTIGVDENSAEFKAHVMSRVADSCDKKNRVSLESAFSYIRRRRGAMHV
jgi:hypothetical protein